MPDMNDNGSAITNPESLTNQIIKNLIPVEPVKILSVRPLGNSLSIRYEGVNSKRTNSKVIPADTIGTLEVLGEEGTFNFKGDPVKFGLHAEATRIDSAYQFDPLFAVNCSIIDPLPHQVEAVYRYMLPQPQIRFLLADDTGAGKTIMTGLLIKELLMRGLVKRILIITPGGLTKQWQEDEMAIKFNIPFRLVNRPAFVSDPNVFNSADRIITSIDFISQPDVLNVASDTHWDLIVFDECHKLSAYSYGRKKYTSRRYDAAQALAKQCEHLLLLTATPHRGRRDTFKHLLQLLDEDIFATEDIAAKRVKEIEKDGINKFFIRRLKEDMKDWNDNPLYKERYAKTVAYTLTHAEKELYDAVTAYLLRKKEEAAADSNIHVNLAFTVMQRRLTSSISAITSTLYKRYRALQDLLQEIQQNPNLLKRRNNLDDIINNIDDYDELDDQERESLENILSDPRQARYFTTARRLGDIKEEAEEVKKLYEQAMPCSITSRKNRNTQSYASC